MKKIYFSFLVSLLSVIGFSQTLLDTAINFTVKDVVGNTINLFDILDENKIVVIDFFATS